jgi:hypothetical protein
MDHPVKDPVLIPEEGGFCFDVRKGFKDKALDFYDGQGKFQGLQFFQAGCPGGGVQGVEESAKEGGLRLRAAAKHMDAGVGGKPAPDHEGPGALPARGYGKDIVPLPGVAADPVNDSPRPIAGVLSGLEAVAARGKGDPLPVVVPGNIPQLNL